MSWSDVSVPAVMRAARLRADSVSTANGRFGSTPICASSSAPGAHAPRAANTLGGAVFAHRYKLGTISLAGLRSFVACSYA